MDSGDYVPETNVKGKLHEYMEQAKHYAKSNRIGIWSEDENPETSLEARINNSEQKTSNRTLSITVTGDFDTPYSGYVEIRKMFANGSIKARIFAARYRMYMLSSWMNHGTTNTSRSLRALFQRQRTKI